MREKIKIGWKLMPYGTNLKLQLVCFVIIGFVGLLWEFFQAAFDNNLNVSETSRQLFLHRNTLVYRIEKLQKVTGLDVRNFDDAMTLKIALMVVNYIDYLENMD